MRECVIVAAVDVVTYLGLLNYRFSHFRMAVPNISDGNAGTQIEIDVTIDILDPDALSLNPHQRGGAGE